MKILINFLTSFLLVSCTFSQSSEPSVKTPHVEIKTEIRTPEEDIRENIANKTPLEEIKNSPMLALPEGIYPEQLQAFFKLGNRQFTLVRQPNRKIEVPLPLGATAKFIGILVAHEGDTRWQKFREVVQDKEALAERYPDLVNPWYLWIQDDHLVMSVVNSGGPGSADAWMSIAFLELPPGPESLPEHCYLYNSDFTKPNGEDWFQSSSKLLQFHTAGISECQEFTLE